MFSSTCTLLVHAIVNTDKKKAELIEMGFFFFKFFSSFLFSVIKLKPTVHCNKRDNCG